MGLGANDRPGDAGSPRSARLGRDLPIAVPGTEEQPNGLRVYMPQGNEDGEGALDQDDVAGLSGRAALTPQISEALAGLGMDILQFKDIIRYAFDRFDTNGDGRLSVAEFRVACAAMSLTIEPEDAEALFSKVSGGKGYWIPEELEVDPVKKLRNAVEAAFKERYKASGLDQMGLILSNIEDAIAFGSPLERLRSLVSSLQVNSENLFEQFEKWVDVVGIAFAGYSIADSVAEGVELDITAVVPLGLLLWKTTGDLKKTLGDSMVTDLCQDHAKVFTLAFKPAGFSLSTFQRLCSEADAQWVFLPEGTSIPLESFGKRLRLIGNGSVKIMSQSAAPGLKETLVLLGPGVYLGNEALLGASRLGPSIRGSLHVAVAAEDTLILELDRSRLQRYLNVDEQVQRMFELTLARSQMDLMAKIKRHSNQIASELPLFFRDAMISATMNFRVDRATLWIHNDDQSVLWTLFVAEDGTSTYVGIDDHSGLAGYCFTHAERVNVPDCYKDSRFNQQVDKTTGYYTQSMLCMPIIEGGTPSDAGGSRPIGVLQLINKLPDVTDSPEQASPSFVAFSPRDEKAVQDSTRLTAVIVKQLGNRYSKTGNNV